MTQLDDRPEVQTDRARQVNRRQDVDPTSDQPSLGRIAAIVLLLAAVTFVAAGVGYLLAGGRQSSRDQMTDGVTPAVTNAPTVAADQATAAPTPPAAPTAAAKPAAQGAPTAPPKPADPPPTVVPPTAAPPTAAPPTVAPSAPSAANRAEKPAPAPAANASAGEGVFIPVRPGMDPRKAQIEGRVQEYFDALGSQDYARAQTVCCTAAWRARYPLEAWQHNFDGVTDLKMVGPPRYRQVEDDRIILDTDYTFQSGGVQRTFTLRWTFTPVGSEWQADLAEAFPSSQ